MNVTVSELLFIHSFINVGWKEKEVVVLAIGKEFKIIDEFKFHKIYHLLFTII